MAMAGISRLLRLAGYPRLLDAPPGAHAVGTRRPRLPGSLYCELSYPAAPRGEAAQSYFRPEAIAGLAEFAHMSEGLFHSVLTTNHPGAAGAPVLKGSWPMVVFIHGLGGCAEMYSQLCMSLASFGYIVFAIEHEDGSGCHATTERGETIRYRRPPEGLEDSREGCISFRKSFLSQRSHELRSALLCLSRGLPPNLEDIYANADLSAGIDLVGHSFGAASALCFIDEMERYPYEPDIPKVRSVVLLDPWLKPVREQLLTRGVRNELLCIVSEAWATDSELMLHIHTLLTNSTAPRVALWAPNTGHQSVSDAQTWAPSIVARLMKTLGRNEKRHATQLACAAACHDFFVSLQLEQQQKPCAAHDRAPLSAHPLASGVLEPLPLSQVEHLLAAKPGSQREQ